MRNDYKTMKKLFLFCLVAMAFAACTKEQLPVANYDIIPKPKEVQLNEEKPFELGPKTIVYYESGLQREAQFLVEYVNDIMGYVLQMQEYQSQPDGIVLKVVPEDFDQAEAYEINITPKQVTIKGADASGVFYGIQALRKSLPISPIDSSQRTFQRRNDMGEPDSKLSTALRNNKRLPQLLLSWNAPRPLPSFHPFGLGKGLHRHAGHAQYEPVPLSSQRGPRLAHRNQEIP